MELQKCITNLTGQLKECRKTVSSDGTKQIKELESMLWAVFKIFGYHLLGNQKHQPKQKMLVNSSHIEASERYFFANT